MKKLLTIPILLFTLMFSSTSYAEWTKVSEGASGNTYYVDFERIRKVDGFVYYWRMSDYMKPTVNGHFSDKTYIQGDCKLFRFKYLSFSFHKEPMGGGTGDNSSPQNPEWDYPAPSSVAEIILNHVCDSAK